ncbi:MAG: hypothetical protein LH616_05435 [Ilumatobacteraceae bacterium]|nr:hypothetical protein [Ilumatobacteraceae bacterium]
MEWPDLRSAPFYAPYLEFDGLGDRTQQYEVRYPSMALIKVYFSPAGTGGGSRPMHPQTFIMDSSNFLTSVG